MTVIPFPFGGFSPIARAQGVRLGMQADLRMESGRVYRAVWMQHGNVTAWWPLSHNRKKPIGLYEPISFRMVVSNGDSDSG